MADRKTIGQRSHAAVNLIREAIYLRDEHRCVVAHTVVHRRWPCKHTITVQHRVSRGMGGSALFDGYAYLVVMCLEHNTRATWDVEFIAVCKAHGWVLPRLDSGINPTLMPVRYYDGWYEYDAESASRYRLPDHVAVDMVSAFLHQPKVDGGSTDTGGAG